MKNFKLLATFITTLLHTQLAYPHFQPNDKNQESMLAYLYSCIIQPQYNIPAAIDASKKVIIFDLDGVLCKTNDLQAFFEIGMDTIIKYMLNHGKPSQAKLFQALEHAPAVTTFDAYHEGMRMPQIIVDWQCNAQELRDIQDSMVHHICNSQLTIEEKNLLINTVLMMTTPEKFIATRQIIPAGIQLARTLKKLGYKLYILSNWDIVSFPLFMQQYPELFIYEDQELFDGIMTSGKTGMIKPHQNIFMNLLKKFNINPQDAIFIDDTIENIHAAEQVGITSVHCKNKNITNVKAQLINLLQ